MVLQSFVVSKVLELEYYQHNKNNGAPIIGLQKFNHELQYVYSCVAPLLEYNNCSSRRLPIEIKVFGQHQ